MTTATRITRPGAGCVRGPITASERRVMRRTRCGTSAQVRPGEGWVRVGGSRFLQTDPIPGGSCNSYDYACQDPINMFDLSGQVLLPPGGGGGGSAMMPTPQPGPSPSPCPGCYPAPSLPAWMSAIGHHVAHVARWVAGKSVVAARWASKHRGRILTVVATGVCVAGAGGCLLATGVALLARASQQPHTRAGYAAIAGDAIATVASAGILGSVSGQGERVLTRRLTRFLYRLHSNAPGLVASFAPGG